MNTRILSALTASLLTLGACDKAPSGDAPNAAPAKAQTTATTAASPMPPADPPPVPLRVRRARPPAPSR